ncbi:DUF2878 domain-containing protein [Echinimonas agarilytica]|uniref:DUF2878 domain-containing protein n=2 Tax=Echinimonas agarilytica TaxID=1215918 RepID=A0AA41W720_9GAMM|nr:DUF2878 domain-containing protein [Echinimonas agarilytica]
MMGDLAVPWVIAWFIGHWSLSPTPKADRNLMVIFLAIGLVSELIHFHSGVLQLPNHSGPLPPLWLLCLWPLFATMLLHSLRWLLAKPYLGAVLAAAGGWISYRAGAVIAGGELVFPLSLMIAFEWAVIFVVACRYLVPLALPRVSR